jgi:hypothetical protein
MNGRDRRFLGFVALNVAFGVADRSSTLLATLHAVTTLLAGLVWAVRGRHDLVAYAGAYLAGAEILWRMTRARVPWEFGKYGLTALMVTAVVRSGCLRGAALPFLYLVLVVPSAVLLITHPGLNYEAIRSGMSSYYSGPLCLTACAWFFSRLGVTRGELVRVFQASAAGATGVAAAALVSVLGAGRIEFENASNAATSGGGGPVHVSTALGLGVFALFLTKALEPRGSSPGVVPYGLMVWFAGQSALTFSRSGLYCAAGGALVALVAMGRGPGGLAKLFYLSIIILFSIRSIIPWLDEFTGGMLLWRFGNTSSTGRDVIMMSDVRIWLEHPFLGVGPGMSTSEHIKEFRGGISSHTEFTRLLAEHGLFGLLADLVLLAAAWANVRRSREPAGRAVAAALTAWSFIFFTTAAFRTAAPALLFGLSFATVVPSEPEGGENPGGPRGGDLDHR